MFVLLFLCFVDFILLCSQNMDRDNKEREFKDVKENEVLRRIPRLAENQVQFLKDTVEEFTKLFIILVNDVDVKNIP